MFHEAVDIKLRYHPKQNRAELFIFCPLGVAHRRLKAAIFFANAEEFRVPFQLGGLRNNTLLAIFSGTIVTVLWAALTWRYGFDLADEGYYWYGAQRMLHGEMPMRDFMAYDIGRYAWTAAIMQLLGDSGIIGARVGAALYQICTVVVGVLLLLRVADGKLSTLGKVLFAGAVAMALNLWVFPYYKVFDYGTSILIVAMLVLMATSQSAKHWFGAGLILGLAAIMGRNHGVYGALAALSLFCFLIVKQQAPGSLKRPAFALIAGTIVGFSPTFVLCALIDGFAAAFITSIIDLFTSGTTNIGLPVPWPWTVSMPEGLLREAGVSKGLGFIAIVLVPMVTIGAMARRPLAEFRQADVLMLCASFAGLAYAHYAYSRADLIHLALAIAPLLLVIFCAGIALSSVSVTSIIVIGLSILTLAPEQTYLAQRVLNKPLRTISINGNTLYVFAGRAAQLREIEQVFATRPQARENFLAVPDMPSLYAIYNKKMPIWEIYSLSARDAAYEEAELARLKAAAPEVVFVSDHALDGRAELRYSNLHPVMYQWITQNYTQLPASSRKARLKVFVK